MIKNIFTYKGKIPTYKGNKIPRWLTPIISPITYTFSQTGNNAALLGTDISWDSNHIYCLLSNIDGVTLATASIIYKFDTVLNLSATYSLSNIMRSCQVMPDTYFYGVNNQNGSSSKVIQTNQTGGSASEIATAFSTGSNYFGPRHVWSAYNNYIYFFEQFRDGNETNVISAYGPTSSLIGTKNYTATNFHPKDAVSVGNDIYIANYTTSVTRVTKVNLLTDAVTNYDLSGPITLNTSYDFGMQMAYDGGDNIAVTSANPFIYTGSASNISLFEVSTGTLTKKSTIQTPYEYIGGITYNNTNNHYYFLLANQLDYSLKVYKTSDLINYTLVDTIADNYNLLMRIKYIQMIDKICLTYNVLVSGQIRQIIKFINP
jgi:hypothetical protein